MGVYFSSYTVPDLLLNSMGLRELPSAWWGWYALSQRHKGAPCPCRGCDNVCCCYCGDDYLPARIPDPSWEVCTVPPSLWELHHRICDLTIPRDPCLGLFHPSHFPVFLHVTRNPSMPISSIDGNEGKLWFQFLLLLLGFYCE